jgi:hypothetical protein
MSEGERKGFSLLNWPSLLAFVLVSWGVLLLPPSLRSLRPSGEPDRSTSGANGPLFESRLWQDPFDVVPEAGKVAKQLPRLDCKMICGSAEAGTKLVLAVFLPGTNYPEDVETRLRSRYAVVSALGVSGYTPAEGGDIRCASCPWPPAASCPSLEAVVPYECYVPARTDSNDIRKFGIQDLKFLTHIVPGNRAPAAITVIWLDERLFDRARVGEGAAVVLEAWAREFKAANLELAILGPQSSGTLQDMLAEPNSGGNPADAGKRIKIYSFSSTVAALRAKPKKARLLDRNFEVVPTIGTDHLLACSLRDELSLRGVSLTDPGSSIALVAEWDTYYSQSMFNAFGDVFLPPEPDPGSRQPEARQLRCFTYQQGIDGRLPRDRPPEDRTKARGNGSVLPGGEPLAATPDVLSFGRSQVDYLQRLVHQMKQTQRGDWAAIGVLGSDFYDKILILETLKHEFPAALFFTTDLDERYLDPSMHKTSRNLLVASHYGLALHENLQRGIPPFRWVYQTSLFLGCLKALRDQGVPAPEASPAAPGSWFDFLDLRIGRWQVSPGADPKMIAWDERDDPCNPGEHEQNTSPRPIVFEVSQSRFNSLTAPGTAGIHPMAIERMRSLRIRTILIPVVLLVLGLIWMLTLWTSLRHWLLVHRWTSAVTVLAVAAILVLVVVDHTRANGEPFSLLEGISSWPAVLVRMVAALFCIFAFVWAKNGDLQNFEQLSERFGLPDHAEAAPNWRISCLLSEKNADVVKPDTVWKWYRWLCQDRQRGWRVIGHFLIYSVFCALLLLILEPPNSPYRGQLNKWTSLGVQLVAGVLAVGLFWFVIDAHRLFIRVVHLFDVRPTDWPEKGQKYVAAISGLEMQSFAHWEPGLVTKLTTSLNWLTGVTILADRSAAIGPMVYSAAFAYLLLFLARSPFFDQFVMSSLLITTFSGALFGVFCCGAWLRYAVRRAQRIALAKVREQIEELRLSESSDDEPGRKCLDAVEQIATAITQIRTGALSPPSEDPILHTLLLIAGGIGALLSMEPVRQFLL